MVSFDEAEIYKLVCLYFFYILSSTTYGRNHNGIYRDDGLACFENASVPKADRIRKDFINIFRKEFLQSIVCETNLKIVNFLDVMVDLTTGNINPIYSQATYHYIRM